MKKLTEKLSGVEKYEWPARLDMICQSLCYFQYGGVEFRHEEYDVNINDIQFEFGPYYKDGFRAIVPDFENIHLVDDKSIGHIEKELNRLNVYVNSDKTRINDFGKALEAAINKILVESDIDARITLPDKNISPYDATIEILDNEIILKHIEIISDRIKKPEILIDAIEKPIMVTKLWDHQSDALGKWLGNDCIGYVNMATATGKTVLGLSTIAALYGRMHSGDSDLEQRKPRENVNILIVANNRLVLEQWKREFDHHLEIPPDITGLGGEEWIEKIDLNWGTIHFVTTDRLRLIGSDYDLVIMDEIHSYPDILNRFKKLIDTKKISILGLSGSIDASETDRREIENKLNRYLKNVKTYTLTDAKNDGIIPDFNWRVIYTGYNHTDQDLIDTTEQCKILFSNLKGSNVPDFDSHDEVRYYSQTLEGIELKEKNLAFDNLAASLFARRTKIWNQYPEIDAMVQVLNEHATSKKCLILLNKREQVKAVEDMLRKIKGESNIFIQSIDSSMSAIEQRNVIENFDEGEKPGVLIGTQKNLGVGVDIRNLEVVVNMSRGRLVNKSLIQNMGRMLRNPEGKSEPIYYHFVPIPNLEETRIPREDGQKLLIGCSQYLAWGDKVGSPPMFMLHDDELDKHLRILEYEGIKHIKTLDEKDKFSWPILGINKEDKKDAKSYLIEIIDSDFPEEGSIIIQKFGYDRNVSEDIEIEEMTEIDHESPQLNGLEVCDFQVKTESGKQFFEMQIKGPLDLLLNELQEFLIPQTNTNEPALEEESKDDFLEDIFEEEVEDLEKDVEEQYEVVELNLSSIKNLDIEIDNIYLLSDKNEIFSPLDEDGEPMSKEKLILTDFSKDENLVVEFNVPARDYELVIKTKHSEERVPLGNLPKN